MRGSGTERNASLEIVLKTHAARFVAVIEPRVQDHGLGAGRRSEDELIGGNERIEISVPDRGRKCFRRVFRPPGERERSAAGEFVALGEPECDRQGRERGPVGGLRRLRKEYSQGHNDRGQGRSINVFFHRVSPLEILKIRALN